MKLLFTIITAVQHRRRGIVRGLGLFMQGLWCCWTAYLHVNALCMCLLCGSLPASIDMQRSSAAELVTRLRVVSYMSLSTAGLHAGALFELAKKANATAPIDCAPAPPTPQVRDTLAPQCTSPGSSGVMLARSSTCSRRAAVQHSPSC